jgi:hypothetical protein
MRIAYLPYIHKIRQYQIAQLDTGRVELRLVKAPETDADTVSKLTGVLAEILQPLEVTTVQVAELPCEKSGKCRPVIGLAAS